MDAKPTLPFVTLVWNDAHSPSATTIICPGALEGIHQCIKVTTVGWVLQDDPEGVTIAGEWVGDDDYRNGTFVPRALVVKMEPVKASRKRTKTSSSFDHGLTRGHNNSSRSTAHTATSPPDPSAS